jgi:hypothetical protein
MRKLCASLLIVLFTCALTATLHAAEKTSEERIKALEDVLGGLSFYGSARFATFYEKSNSDFLSDTDGVTKINSTPALTGPDQKTTQWALANNSRFGLSAKREDNLGGRVEIGLKNDGSVGLRLGYGTYTYNDVTFLFGQDYTPLSEWDYSNQVFNGDNALAGWGVIDVDGKRIPQVKIKWKGLQIAFVNNKKADTLNLPTTANASTQVLLPTIQAKYRFSADKFFGDVFGGAGTYKVKSETLAMDKTVTSYAFGAGGGVKIDPVFAKAMVWMARNGKQLSLHQADAAGATFDLSDYSIINDKDFGWTVVAGAKIQKVSFEAGYGFVSSEKDTSGADKDQASNYYANMTIPIAQNAVKTASFVVVPEIGVYDYMKNSAGAEQGKAEYAGAKWQVNF